VEATEDYLITITTSSTNTETAPKEIKNEEIGEADPHIAAIPPRGDMTTGIGIQDLLIEMTDADHILANMIDLDLEVDKEDIKEDIEIGIIRKGGSMEIDLRRMIDTIMIDTIEMTGTENNKGEGIDKITILSIQGKIDTDNVLLKKDKINIHTIMTGMGRGLIVMDLQETTEETTSTITAETSLYKERIIKI